MNTTKRFILQILFWFVIWLVLWSQQSWEISFVRENVLVYVTQISIVSILVYYLVPKFLFHKKYIPFICISILVLTLFSYIATQVPKQDIPIHQMEKQVRGMRLPPKMEKKISTRPPLRIFTMSLLLFASYSLTVVIEIILFAQKKEEEIVLSKNENLQTELKLLKSQINPHFLFNSLNNIYALSGIDTQRTQQSITYLSDMLRYVLYECENAFVPIKHEVTYIENYIKLYALKSSKKYPIEIVFNNLNANVTIAPMLLIPFVENAFKHSNIEKIKDTFIKISLDTRLDVIVFKIENTFSKTLVQKDTIGGIGIENTKRRLAILYPNQYALTIDEKEGVFKVELKLNLHV